MSDASADLGAGGRLPAAFLTPGSSSFTDFLAAHAAHLLPGRRALPQGSASRLVATLAHPLNQAEFSADGRSVIAGYSVLQPRVSTTYRPSPTFARNDSRESRAQLKTWSRLVSWTCSGLWPRRLPKRETP